MKRRYTVLLVLLIVITGAVFLIRSFLANVEMNLGQLQHLEIITPELGLIPDGRYEGMYETFPVKVRVRVTV